MGHNILIIGILKTNTYYRDGASYLEVTHTGFRDGASEPSRMHEMCVLVHITRLASHAPGSHGVTTF